MMACSLTFQIQFKSCLFFLDYPGNQDLDTMTPTLFSASTQWPSTCCEPICMLLIGYGMKHKQVFSQNVTSVSIWYHLSHDLRFSCTCKYQLELGFSGFSKEEAGGRTFKSAQCLAVKHWQNTCCIQSLYVVDHIWSKTLELAKHETWERVNC